MKQFIFFLLFQLHALSAMRCEVGFDLVKEEGVDICLKVIKDKKKICTYEAKSGECLEIGYKTIYLKDYKRPIFFGDDAYKMKLSDDREDCKTLEREVKTKYYVSRDKKSANKYCELRAEVENAKLVKTYFVAGTVSCLFKKSFEQCD